MAPIFTATGLFLFYCACIPVKIALVVRCNGHTDFGAGISIFNGRPALENARLRACGEKKRWPWKQAQLDLEKKGVLAAALHAGGYLLRHTTLEQIHLSGSIALPDAAQTALLCACLHTLQGVFTPLLPQDCLRLQPKPDFSGSASNVLLSGMIRIPLGHIMLAALKGAGRYLQTAKSIRRTAHGKASH